MMMENTCIAIKGGFLLGSRASPQGLVADFTALTRSAGRGCEIWKNGNQYIGEFGDGKRRGERSGYGTTVVPDEALGPFLVTCLCSAAGCHVAASCMS